MPPDTELTERDLQYYYHGLHRVLRRYRTATVAGWLIVLAGVLSIPVGWGAAGAHGLIDLVLAGATIAAGLFLVSEAVSFLDAYLSVPFTEAQAAGTNDPAPLAEIKELMEEIRTGGWQEAYAGIQRLRQLPDRYALPPLQP